ncbi:organic cation transporter 1-like [Homarus americanus]|nr:organic cation transporter 1-like [Homarus americanus]
MTWQERHPDSSPTQFTTECVFGYDFDRTYFEETEATEMGWACGEVGAIQQVLHAAMLGNLFGCVIYGALADKVGRRLVFLLLALKVAVLGSTYVFLKEMWVVLMVRFLVSMGLPVLYQIVIISALEQVRDEHRGMVTSLSSICFSVGQCLLALVTWLTGHWVKLGLVTSVPALLALVYIKVIEESPRWLVARGRLEEAAKVLLRVAKMNRLAPTHRDVLARLHKACGHPLDSPPRTQRSGRESNACLGILGLLTLYPRLCYRTALVTVCWTVNLILYFSSTMKYPYVFENPFLGWFCTSAMEIPANLLVLVLLRKIGRRPLHAGVMSLCAAALLCAAVVLAFGYGERHRGVAALVLVAKFCTSMTFLVIYLQAAELHPTPVRTCATGFASLIALTCNIFSPSILTMTHPWQSYLLMGCLGCAGVLSAALLPETKDRPLPQTLEEAENLTRRPKVSKDEGRRGSLEVDLVSKSSLSDPASSVLKATDVETNI